ncbi:MULTISPECIES: hypothetical protein [unclassified Microcoleus]|nr:MULTISPECIES: hypothetical protein [unclassified Microcoleus]
MKEKSNQEQACDSKAGALSITDYPLPDIPHSGARLGKCDRTCPE